MGYVLLVWGVVWCERSDWMGVRNLGVLGVGAGKFGGLGNGLGWFGQRDGGDWVRRSVAWEVGRKGRPRGTW